MSNRVILNFDEALLAKLEGEQRRSGATRNGAVVRILEGYFEEQEEKKRLYDEWFMAEVERGLESAENEPLHDHADIMREIDDLIEAKRPRDASQVV